MSSISPHRENSLRGKIQSLESLRGLAALVVVLSHLQLTFWWGRVDHASPPLWGLWHNADFAVRLFFVLSGFVLSRSYFVTYDVGVVRSAAARRYFRLAVPAAASVGFAYLLCVTGAMANHELAERVADAPHQWLHSFYMVPPTVWAAAREALFGAYFDFQYTTSLNVVLWTMTVELQGSFLIFAVLALCGSARHRWIIYAALLLVLDGVQAKYLVDFVVGLAICDWHCQIPDSPRWQAAALLLFCVGLCLGDLRGTWLESCGASFLVRGTRLWPTIAAACLVMGATRSAPIQRILGVRPLVELGSISFSLYLFHLPLICSLGASLYSALQAAGFSHDVSAASASAACVLSSLAVAKLGAIVLDPRALQIGRWVESLFFGTADVGRAARASSKSSHATEIMKPRVPLDG